VEALGPVSDSKRLTGWFSTCDGNLPTGIDPFVIVLWGTIAPPSTSVLSEAVSGGKVTEFLERMDCEEDPSEMNDCRGSSCLV